MQYLKNVVTLELNREKCAGCGVCMEVCPHQVFRLEDGKAAINNRDSCIECGACALNCFFSAVSVKVGVGCAYAVIKGKFKKGKTCC